MTESRDIHPGDRVYAYGAWFTVAEVTNGRIVAREDGALSPSEIRDVAHVTRHLRYPDSTPSAPSNTMAPMLEPNAPETQEPQTPDLSMPPPEEPEVWKPSAETLAGATNLAMLASTLMLRDPQEAARLLGTAAELIDPAPHEPGFWETLSADLVKMAPTLVPMIERLTVHVMEQQNRDPLDYLRNRPPFDPCLRGTITDCFPTPRGAPEDIATQFRRQIAYDAARASLNADDIRDAALAMSKAVRRALL